MKGCPPTTLDGGAILHLFAQGGSETEIPFLSLCLWSSDPQPKLTLLSALRQTNGNSVISGKERGGRKYWGRQAVDLCCLLRLTFCHQLPNGVWRHQQANTCSFIFLSRPHQQHARLAVNQSDVFAVICQQKAFSLCFYHLSLVAHFPLLAQSDEWSVVRSSAECEAAERDLFMLDCC